MAKQPPRPSGQRREAHTFQPVLFNTTSMRKDMHLRPAGRSWSRDAGLGQAGWGFKFVGAAAAAARWGPGTRHRLVHVGRRRPAAAAGTLAALSRACARLANRSVLRLCSAPAPGLSFPRNEEQKTWLAAARSESLAHSLLVGCRALMAWAARRAATMAGAHLLGCNIWAC